MLSMKGSNSKASFSFKEVKRFSSCSASDKAASEGRLSAVNSRESASPCVRAWGYGTTAGIEYALARWIPIRAELGAFTVGASAWDDSLYRFRAFWGYRVAAMTGMPLTDSESIEVLAMAEAQP